MTNKYVVRVTNQAKFQLEEIIRYVASNLNSPETRLRLLQILEDSISSLSRMPHRIALIKEEPWRSKGIHKMSVKNFIIYFNIDDNNLNVHIIGIIYNRRNQIEQLLQI